MSATLTDENRIQNKSVYELDNGKRQRNLLLYIKVWTHFSSAGFVAVFPQALSISSGTTSEVALIKKMKYTVDVKK